MLTSMINSHLKTAVSSGLSHHAEWRMAQRNLSQKDVAFVLAHGQRFFGAGALIVFLSRKDIPERFRRDSEIMRLEGTVVVVSPFEPVVMTVYRNREKGLQQIKKKSRQSRSAQRRVY